MKNIFNFIKLLEEFQKVERAVHSHANSKRMEHDVEHSYELAMLAWYIIDSKKLKLNLSKVIRYALLHDIVEVYAGDTPVFPPKQKHHEDKEEREHKALLKLKKNFPEFKEMHKTIIAYESRKDKESNFVYALDKIHPIIKIYLDDGKIWKKRKVTFEMLKNNKNEKVAVSPEVKKIYDELVKVLGKDKKKLF